jgi:catechol-2,3-dioxygenase
MTHSVYLHDPNGHGIELLCELPREMWEKDIDGALNYSVRSPTEGAAALDDRLEAPPTFG